MMNRRAKATWPDESHFVNPKGLPDPPGQMMSASILQSCRGDLSEEYPAYYHYFGEKSYSTTDLEGQSCSPIAIWS